MDLLLHRYQNIEYVLSLDLSTFMRLILKAIEKERDERIFTQWVVQLPNMTKENYKSFDDYKAHVLGLDIDRRPTEEILRDLRENHGVEV